MEPVKVVDGSQVRAMGAVHRGIVSAHRIRVSCNVIGLLQHIMTTDSSTADTSSHYAVCLQGCKTK